jgi:hypothetical protein
MPTLHLGVNDMPYNRRGGMTTHGVAMILEARYGLFSAFVDMHAPVINHVVENSLQGAIETMLMGGGTGNASAGLATATSELEDLFREAIDMQSYDFKLPGTPTGAAQRGVRHSFAKPYARRDPRPSFFDTGLLSSSFRSWVD